MRIISFSIKSLAFVAAILSSSIAAALSPGSGCHSTPEEAIESSSMQPRGNLRSFRVSALRWDPLLQQQWAIVVSCTHPELPPLTLRVPGGGNRRAASMNTALPVIRRGDAVRVWSQKPFVRIERNGIAEGDAALGEIVRIRIIKPLSNDVEGTGISNTTETLPGIVRGRHEVEIEP